MTLDQINKKRGRGIIFEGDEHAQLYTFLPSGDGQLTYVDTVTRQEAHDWFHGAIAGNPKIDPTVDEMLEAIAVKLQDDIRRIMLACSESESWLRDMYSRSKEPRLSVSPPWR